MEVGVGGRGELLLMALLLQLLSVDVNCWCRCDVCIQGYVKVAAVMHACLFLFQICFLLSFFFIHAYSPTHTFIHTATLSFIYTHTHKNTDSQTQHAHSFGVMLWELYMTRRPYAGYNAVQVCAAKLLHKETLTMAEGTPEAYKVWVGGWGECVGGCVW